MVYKNVLFRYVAVVEVGIIRAEGQECWQRMYSLCGKIKVNIKKKKFCCYIKMYRPQI